MARERERRGEKDTHELTLPSRTRQWLPTLCCRQQLHPVSYSSSLPLQPPVPPALLNLRTRIGSTGRGYPVLGHPARVSGIDHVSTRNGVVRVVFAHSLTFADASVLPSSTTSAVSLTYSSTLSRAHFSLRCKFLDRPSATDFLLPLRSFQRTARRQTWHILVLGRGCRFPFTLPTPRSTAEQHRWRCPPSIQQVVLPQRQHHRLFPQPVQT